MVSSLEKPSWLPFHITCSPAHPARPSPALAHSLTHPHWLPVLPCRRTGSGPGPTWGWHLLSLTGVSPVTGPQAHAPSGPRSSPAAGTPTRSRPRLAPPTRGPLRPLWGHGQTGHYLHGTSSVCPLTPLSSHSCSSPNPLNLSPSPPLVSSLSIL